MKKLVSWLGLGKEVSRTAEGKQQEAERDRIRLA